MILLAGSPVTKEARADASRNCQDFRIYRIYFHNGLIFEPDSGITRASPLLGPMSNKNKTAVTNYLESKQLLLFCLCGYECSRLYYRIELRRLFCTEYHGLHLNSCFERTYNVYFIARYLNEAERAD